MGKVSKQVVEKIVHNIRIKTNTNQWKNTNDVIYWFNAIKDKSNYTMICFDICNFYLSITNTLLQKALNYASKYADISEDQIYPITHTREVGDEQAGFRKNSGTREGIFNLKMIVEKYIETQKDIYACFIDYSKAFDTVNHEKLIECLKTTDIDQSDIALIANLYWEQDTKIRIGNDMSESLKIKRGVRQGCVLSPSLFNLYTEHIFRHLFIPRRPEKTHLFIPKRPEKTRKDTQKDPKRHFYC